MPLYRKLAINTAIYRFLSNGPMSEKKKILTEIYPPLFYELGFILLLLMLLLDFFTLHEKLFFLQIYVKNILVRAYGAWELRYGKHRYRC